MNSPLPKVTCYTDTDLVHAAYATTGLIELAEAGKIDLEFQLTHSRLTRYRGPFTLFLTINEKLPVCLDFHDSNSYYCTNSLDTCDIYYKANWSVAGMGELNDAQRAKVRPFGPYTPCLPLAEQAFPMRVFGNTVTHLRHRIFHPMGAGGVTRLIRGTKHSCIQRKQRYESRMKWRKYESPPHKKIGKVDAPLVFFNPSCRPEDGKNITRTNRLRAELIVRLRESLGLKFAGGFRRNALAEQKYHDAVEDRHYSHDDYVQFLHAAPISIYTNGLSGCFSWRLLETFAGAKAIVSEPLVNDPGYQLGEEQGFLECGDAEAMIDTVMALSKDRDRLYAMQLGAWRTYVEQMRPHVRMQSLIAEMIGVNPGPQVESAASVSA